MQELLQTADSVNFISAALVLTVAVSALQGMMRGARGSARLLASMIAELLMTAISLYAAWQCASWLSPSVHARLVSLNVQIPTTGLGFFGQLYYTIVTGIRDFPLMRAGTLFLVGYIAVKQLLRIAAAPFLYGLFEERLRERPAGPISSVTGGLLGAVGGTGRALMLVAALFMVATMFPDTPAASYIQASQLYQTGAKRVIEPVTGDFVASKLPVLTRSVGQEFTAILQRKYEVLDAAVPSNIADAAKEVTANGKTDEEKARLLYKWVGTRVRYDWDKVEQYEQRRIWKEQTPEQTFSTKLGVCIDYARLYAVMARSVGLDVKVVTGIGYDGAGGSGPHAWNEVYLSEKKQWVPLDSTWVASGGNWFNPPDFDRTHVKDA